MSLLEAIATMASELSYSKQWKQVSIEVNFADENKTLIKAKCYPIIPTDPVAIFNLTFDQELVKRENK